MLRGAGSRVFWAYPTIVVQDTPELVALYLPCGAAGKNVARRPEPLDLLSPGSIPVVDHTWHTTDVLMLIVPGEAFSVYAMRAASTRDLDCWYINLQEPLRRTRIGFDTMDQMLDVVVSPDFSGWKWKDADEFAETECIGYYSPEQAQAIRAEGEKAVDLLTSTRRAFYERWLNWQPEPAWGIPVLSPLWERIDLTIHD